MASNEKRSFYNNVAILISGNALAQTIPFISMPFLQRYFYDPIEFAAFFAFVRFADVFMTISSFKMEFGLVMIKDAAHRLDLHALISRILIGFTIVVALALIPVAPVLYDQYHPIVGTLFYLVPILMLFFGWYQLAYYELNAQSKFKGMAIMKLFQTVSSEGMKFITGFLQFDALGLILGRVAGIIIAVFYGFYVSGLRLTKLYKKNIEGRKQLWLENRDFALYTTPTVLVKTVLNLSVFAIIYKYYGGNNAGNFGASMIYLSAMFGVLSASFGQVYYNRISQITTRGQMLQYYFNWLKNLSLFALAAFVIIQIFPNKFITYILGDDWKTLLPIAKIMSVWMVIQFVSGSLSFIYIRLKKQRIMLLLDLFHLVIVLGALGFSVYMESDLNGLLWGYTVMQAFFYLIAILAAIIFIKKSEELDG